MEIKEIKKRGRELTRNNMWNFWKVYLIVMIISFLTTYLTTSMGESASMIASLIMVIVMSPLYAGIYYYLLNIIRKKPFEVNNIFSYFKFIIPLVILNILMSLFIMLWSLLLIIPGIIAALSYAMAMYLFVDGETDPLACIKKSKVMMKGYKGNFFLLGLSFIGWMLLGILTLGILYIWLVPYMQFSFISYYEELKNKSIKEN